MESETQGTLAGLPVGRLYKRKDPIAFKEGLQAKPARVKRVVGVDLGTNCGFSFCDVVPDQPIENMVIVGGIWDLSLGNYDTGPLRHIRLKQFLEASDPDLVMYEDVKFNPPLDLIKAKKMSPAAIIARVAHPLEFLGGLKMTLATWCEEAGVPAHGVAIKEIKKFATGKGNANKKDMIEACNKKFGTTIDVEEYESTGSDNVVDAIFVCALGVYSYFEGLREKSQ